MEEVITILKEIQDTLENQNKPKMLRIADVAVILGVNREKAGKLWDLEDFPRNNLGTQTSRRNSFF